MDTLSPNTASAAPSRDIWTNGALRAQPAPAPLHMPEQSLAPTRMWTKLRRWFSLPTGEQGSLESGS